jgi:DNA-binding NtrC family response regulator
MAWQRAAARERDAAARGARRTGRGADARASLRRHRGVTTHDAGLGSNARRERIVVRIDQPFGAAIQHLERAMVHAALAKTRSVDEAAKLLGVSRKGLYLKRLRYGMEIDRPKNGSEVA